MRENCLSLKCPELSLPPHVKGKVVENMGCIRETESELG